ncbi:MAG: hypothetical protein RIR31_1801, partial [Bacteroidota bacterium]
KSGCDLRKSKINNLKSKIEIRCYHRKEQNLERRKEV